MQRSRQYRGNHRISKKARECAGLDILLPVEVLEERARLIRRQHIYSELMPNIDIVRGITEPTLFGTLPYQSHPTVAGVGEFLARQVVLNVEISPQDNLEEHLGKARIVLENAATALVDKPFVLLALLHGLGYDVHGGFSHLRTPEERSLNEIN